jgi:hypothetical protein
MEIKKPISEFDKALKAILRVSKVDMKLMLAREKRANAGKPKRGPKPVKSGVSVVAHPQG